jgi:hypothetical protein
MIRMGKLLVGSILGMGALEGFMLPPIGSHAQQPPGAFPGGIHYPIAGQPPLTFDMVQRATNFFQWLLEAPLTPEQRQQFQNAVAQSWLSGRQDEVQSTLEIIQFNDQLMISKSVTEREIVRQTVQPKYIAQLRAQPNSDLSRWVLSIYDSAHKPLAAGNPPLTPQVVDAYVAFLSFMAYQSLGNNWNWKGPGSFHDAVAQPIIASYPSLSADQQAAMAQIPLEWAQLNDAWPKSPLAQRQQLCAQLKPTLQQFFDNLSKAAAAAKPTGTPGSVDQLANKVNQQMMVNSFISSSMTKINTMITTGRPVF